MDPNQISTLPVYYDSVRSVRDDTTHDIIRHVLAANSSSEVTIHGMRLIRVDDPDLPLEEFNEHDIPEYAILSHTWSREEVIFSDLPLNSSQATRKAGHEKVMAFCAETYSRGLSYAWIDTCCINKSSTTELGEAINSMYRWYSKASVCIAYIADYDLTDGVLGTSRWFTRGWTLQELIAPDVVEFFDTNWLPCGTKADLKDQISHITGIDERVLSGADPRSFSIAQRMSWAAGRNTTRVEDRAYSLLGLFNVTISLIYGISGTGNAFITLQEAIMKESNDHTMFAWNHDQTEPGRDGGGFLASSPDAFAGCHDVVQSHSSGLNMDGYTMTNAGLALNLYTEPYFMHTYVAVLDCCPHKNPDSRYGVLVEQLEDNYHYARVRIRNVTRVELGSKTNQRTVRKICIRQNASSALNQRYGFWVRTLASTINEADDEQSPVKLLSPCQVAENASHGYFMELLPSLTGTVGVLQYQAVARMLQKGETHKSYNHQPSTTEYTYPYQIQKVKLGFDNEFQPALAISLCDTIFSSTNACHPQSNKHKSIVTRPTLYEHSGLQPETETMATLFDNSWLAQTTRSPTSDDLQKQYIFKFSVPTTTTLRLGKMVKIDFQLSMEQCPPPKEKAETSTNTTWKIWTIDLTVTSTKYSLTHDEAVAFGVKKPCGRAVGVGISHAIMRWSDSFSGLCCNSGQSGWIGLIVLVLMICILVPVIASRSSH